MDIMKWNKIIAEFMGEKFTDSSGVVQGLNYKLIEKKHGEGNNGFRFHTSWDWLMPVVEKIRRVTSYDRDKFSTEVIIYGNKTTIKSGGYEEKRHSNLFFNKTVSGTWNTTEATYQAVVEFIKWYNQNKED